MQFRTNFSVSERKYDSGQSIQGQNHKAQIVGYQTDPRQYVA